MPAGGPVAGRVVPVVPGSAIVPLPGVLQGSLKLLRVYPRLFERFTAHPVRERKLHGFPDVVAGDDRPPIKGGDRLCRADDGDIGAVSPDSEPDARLRHRIQEGVVDRDGGEQHPCGNDLSAQRLLRRAVRLPAPSGIALEYLGGPDDRHSLRGILDPLHGHLQPEPVEQLRPEFPLLRVHGADQDEPGRVGERYPLPLHDVDAHGGDIEEDVGHVVVEQVDLVDIENPAVDRREEARIDRHLPLADRPLHIDGAHHPVLGRPEREVDDADPAMLRFKVLTGGLFFGAGSTQAAVGITIIRAAPDHVDPGEHVGKRPDCSGLCGPFLAADEDAADPRVDGVEDERAFHRLLADDGGERKDVPPDLVRHT
ncbi:hypothetical protein DSECCO2_617520 [anaerobic digester metagenome]